MSRHQQLGRWGEQVAADYLLARGYEIVARNIRTPYGEIDLIARKEGLLIFVEVKARRSRAYGPPEIAVAPRKQEHMLACAEHYAAEHGIDHWQIDVIAIEGTPQANRPSRVTHFENALT